MDIRESSQLVGIEIPVRSETPKPILRFYPLRAAAHYAISRAAGRLAVRIDPRIAARFIGPSHHLRLMGPYALHEMLHVVGDRTHVNMPVVWVEPFRPDADR